MSIALLPGSYDPITVGHLDMIARATTRFDEVVVAVMNNAAKTYRFTKEIGEVLAKLCDISRRYNVDIRIRQCPEYLPSPVFELGLDRGKHHVRHLIDTDHTVSGPAKCLEYAFERMRYDIKQSELEEKKYEDKR